jgi:hypothetical protein
MNNQEQAQPALWDPLASLGLWRPWVWGLLGVVILAVQGPSFVREFAASGTWPGDFFQDWASARLLWQGQPASALLLVVLPLSRLDYPTAFLVWNILSFVLLLASIGLMARELGISWAPWGIFPLLLLLLLGIPLRDHLQEGQLSIVLLALLVGCWAAEQNSRPYLAGLLLAAAIAFKIFPALLLAYFCLRRQWRVVAATVAGLTAIALLSVAILGFETHHTYFFSVLPHLSEQYASNLSLTGFWHRLFDLPDEVRLRKLNGEFYFAQRIADRPDVARLASILSQLAVLAVWGIACWRSCGRAAQDRAVALTISAMLLVSPITWTHSFVLLLFPAALIWRSNPAAPGLFLLAFGVLWLDGAKWLQAWLPSFLPATEVTVNGQSHLSFSPFCTLAVCLLPCLSQLALFAFVLIPAASELPGPSRELLVAVPSRATPSSDSTEMSSR